MKKNISQKKPVQKLYRSKVDRIIGGVCGGIGEYYNTDPLWIRLIFILLVLMDGIGILFYIIAWIVIPENPYQKDPEKKKEEKKKPEQEKTKSITEKKSEFQMKTKNKNKNKDDSTIIVGIILLSLGLIFLLKNFVKWIDFGKFWPIILIILGIYLMRKKK